MKNKELPTQQYLNECLAYDPKTGLLYWKHRPRTHFKDLTTWKIWNTKYSKHLAFNCIDKYGYKYGTLNYIKYLAHRVIYKLVHGIDPEIILHENGDTLDNRIEKLSSGTLSENSRDMKKSKANSSGVTGVHWDKRREKWISFIHGKGGRKHLGYFDDFEKAVVVRKAAEVELGYHPNHGRDLQTVTL